MTGQEFQEDLVRAWRIPQLRNALIEAQRRGGDFTDDGEDLRHRALKRRFLQGRAVLQVLAQDLGVFVSIGRKSQTFVSREDRRYVADCLLNLVSRGKLVPTRWAKLAEIARKQGLRPPTQAFGMALAQLNPKPKKARRKRKKKVA